MADDKKENWLNWLALSTLIFSAAATLGSSKSGGFGSKAMAEQILASDSWAYYQAKSIKLHSFELQRDALTLQVLSAPEAVQPKYKETIDRYTGEIKHYTDDKKTAYDDAKTHEKSRDDSKRYGGIFGTAVLYLQIAIIITALGALLKKKPLWYISFFPGVAGLVYFSYAFWLTW
jgi:hypothetical protein